MKALIRVLHHAAEGIAALMLAVLFGTFVVQVFSRYVLAAPIGWTLEVCLTLWVWLVFWGNALVVREKDHVTFDMLYLAAGEKLRRAMALISALAIIVALGVSFLPTWDYIEFLRIKRSPTLKIPMRDVFSIYMLFLAAAMLGYAWRIYHILRHGVVAQRHHLEITDE